VVNAGADQTVDEGSQLGLGVPNLPAYPPFLAYNLIYNPGGERSVSGLYGGWHQVGSNIPVTGADFQETRYRTVTEVQLDLGYNGSSLLSADGVAIHWGERWGSSYASQGPELHTLSQISMAGNWGCGLLAHQR
jgi:hypothetical protein